MAPRTWTITSPQSGGPAAFLVTGPPIDPGTSVEVVERDHDERAETLKRCPDCEGVGYIEASNERCPRCEGRGVLAPWKPDESTVKAVVEALRKWAVERSPGSPGCITAERLADFVAERFNLTEGR